MTYLGKCIDTESFKHDVGGDPSCTVAGGATFGWSLSNWVALCRMNLFVYRDLWVWLSEPFERPPDLPQPVQRQLALR